MTSVISLSLRQSWTHVSCWHSAFISAAFFISNSRHTFLLSFNTVDSWWLGFYSYTLSNLKSLLFTLLYHYYTLLLTLSIQTRKYSCVNTCKQIINFPTISKRIINEVDCIRKLLWGVSVDGEIVKEILYLFQLSRLTLILTLKLCDLIQVTQTQLQSATSDTNTATISYNKWHKHSYSRLQVTATWLQWTTSDTNTATVSYKWHYNWHSGNQVWLFLGQA